MPAVAPRYSADHGYGEIPPTLPLDDNAVQTLIAAIHEEPKRYLEGLGHLNSSSRNSKGGATNPTTGVILKPVPVQSGRRPSSSTCPASRPISSVVSRRAATTGLSSWASTRPPGKLICPGW